MRDLAAKSFVGDVIMACLFAALGYGVVLMHWFALPIVAAFVAIGMTAWHIYRTALRLRTGEPAPRFTPFFNTEALNNISTPFSGWVRWTLAVSMLFTTYYLFTQHFGDGRPFIW